jgi:FtsP/CotA-like multicopper oxidase with cupredoxin domain
VLHSRDGVLAVDLLAAPTAVRVGGQVATLLAYNGAVPGPTLRLRPGDRLRVRLANALTEATNLHTHGLAVSPTANADNPFVAVAPGETFAYDISLPQTTPPGPSGTTPTTTGRWPTRSSAASTG